MSNTAIASAKPPPRCHYSNIAYYLALVHARRVGQRSHVAQQAFEDFADTVRSGNIAQACHMLYILKGREHYPFRPLFEREIFPFLEKALSNHWDGPPEQQAITA
jgi:hypothetical protein